jgi:hypothetical protein
MVTSLFKSVFTYRIRRTYRIEEEEVIIGVEVQWSHMTSLLIPLTMEVIGHDSHPVQIFTKSLDIIA